MMSLLDFKRKFERALFALGLSEGSFEDFPLIFCIFCTFTEEKKKDCIARKRPTPSPPMKKNGKHKAACCQEEWKCLIAGRGKKSSWIPIKNFIINRLLRILPRAIL